MQRLLVLFLAFLFPFFTSAQEGLKLSAQVTPSFSFSFNLQDTKKGAALQEQAAFGYTAGILVGYGITEAFSLSTGVFYYEHSARFNHQRTTLSTGVEDPNLGQTALRFSNYIRVPLLLGLASDPNRKWGVLARFGPHFNFLLQARYYDTRLNGYSKYNQEQGIDLRQEITLYQENGTTGGLIREGGKAPVYKGFIPGISAEIGLQLRLNDQLKLTALVHVEGSSNPEAEGAASFAHNLARGDFLVTSSPFDAPELTKQDNDKFQAEATPFDAMFPNYTEEDYQNVTSRAPTWQVMVGLQLGIVYTYKK
ncbi:MAG: outer membrane beta-barrel protein [Aureispira sp.]